jgi:hypothetical protein
MPFMLNVIMLRVKMLNVIMMCVIAIYMKPESRLRACKNKIKLLYINFGS